MVGCGHIAGSHIAAVRRVPGVVVVAVCDPDPAATARIARMAGGCPAYESQEALLAAEHPDVVHVLTPPASHHRLAVAALESGCHVLVEKPMALSAAEAEEMVAASKRALRHLCVDHNFLFEPGVRRALGMARAGDLGRITSVDLFWRVLRGAEPGLTPAWVRGLPGGVFQEVAPHGAYIVDALLPDLRIAAVLARDTSGGGDGTPDELRVLFDSNAGVGTLALSVGSRPHVVTLILRGARASVAVDLTTNVLVPLRKSGVGRSAKLAAAAHWSGRYLAGTAANAARVLLGRLPSGRESLVQAFYQSLRDGSPPPVSGEDGRRIVALLDRIREGIEGPDPAPAA